MTTTKTPPFETRAIGDVDFSLRSGTAYSGLDEALQSLDPQTRAIFGQIKKEKEAEALQPPHEPMLHGTAPKTEEVDLPLTPPPGQEDAPEYTDRQGNGMNMAEEKASSDEYYSRIIEHADIRDTMSFPSTGVKVEYYGIHKNFPSVQGAWVDTLEELYIIHTPGKGTRTVCLINDKNYPNTLNEDGTFCTTNAHNGTKLIPRNGMDDASDFLPTKRAYPLSASVNKGKGRVCCHIFPDGKLSLSFVKGNVKGHEYFVKTREGGILTVNAEHRLVLADADKLPPDLPQQDRDEHFAFVSAVQGGEKSLADILEAPANVSQEKARTQQEKAKVQEFLSKEEKPSFVQRLLRSSGKSEHTL